jgi:integrase
MSTLSNELDRYLAIRRSLGFDLGTTEGILRRFIAFAKQQNADYITTDLFLRWQKEFGHAHRSTWARRLGMVRLLAQWLRGLDQKHEVPPKTLIPARYQRIHPYIYKDEEIRRIVMAAEELPSINGVRALSYSTLFGLIAVTGLRISEALSLDVTDADLKTGVLTLRRGKFGKARLLPISASTIAHLTAYIRERDRLLGASPKSFFVSDRGERITSCSAQYTFALICQTIGLRPVEKWRRHGHGPRIHDLRHTFAVRTLVNWYRTGKDPAREMIKLTTYLGHAHPKDTYWYIEAVPELLNLASLRAERSMQS